MLRILSLGAGVQSTTLALMSTRGDLPRVDYAIFADTGWEPQAVYDHLAWLEGIVRFPIIRTTRPGADLGEHSIAIATSDVTRTASPPWFTEGPRGMLPRQCSKEFKVRVIGQEVRKLLGLERGQRGPKEVAVEQWIGISTDEMQRMKRSEQAFVENVFPLIDRRMTRNDCLQWMRERQFPQPPKSSCIFCPYRGDHQWREMRDHAPADWAKAVDFDKRIRPGFHGMQGEAFIHRQRVPLEQVDLSTDADRGQFSLFDEISREASIQDECEGICGT